MFTMAYGQYKGFLDHIDKISEIDLSGIRTIIALRSSLARNIEFCGEKIDKGIK